MTNTASTTRSATRDPYAKALERLATAVVWVRGTLPPAIRAAARDGECVPRQFEAYVQKVREYPYKVTDADVETLRARGCSEEEIFEITIATAVGEGLRRIDAGLRALDDSTSSESTEEGR